MILTYVAVHRSYNPTGTVDIICGWSVNCACFLVSALQSFHKKLKCKHRDQRVNMKTPLFSLGLIYAIYVLLKG
jgi:hypothetical protein